MDPPPPSRPDPGLKAGRLPSPAWTWMARTFQEAPRSGAEAIADLLSLVEAVKKAIHVLQQTASVETVPDLIPCRRASPPFILSTGLSRRNV